MKKNIHTPLTDGIYFQIIPHIFETSNAATMVYTNWYPGAPSMTASKYLKYSAAYTKPFEPGQRYRNRRDMELTVREDKRGFLDCANKLDVAC